MAAIHYIYKIYICINLHVFPQIEIQQQKKKGDK